LKIGDTKTPMCTHCGQNITLPDEMRHIQLQGRQIVILVLLHNAAGRVVKYADLGRRLNSIQQQISSIRTALSDAGVGWDIENVKEQGYRLIKIKGNET